MYTVFLAARNEPESSVTASTLSHAKAIVNDFLQTHSKGARVRIEGPHGGTVFEYTPSNWPASKFRADLHSPRFTPKPFVHEAPFTVLEMPAGGPQREVDVWESEKAARKVLDAFCSRNRRHGAAAALYKKKVLLESRDCDGGVWVVTGPRAGGRRKHR